MLFASAHDTMIAVAETLPEEVSWIPDGETGERSRWVYFQGQMLRAHPAASPFSWDVSEKQNVVADWHPAGEGGRSLVLNGHIDVVAPAAASLWRTAPFAAVRAASPR